ncbi:MAG: hypothetical protein V7K32_01355 [Nostoc sp.]
MDCPNPTPVKKGDRQCSKNQPCVTPKASMTLAIALTKLVKLVD